MAIVLDGTTGITTPGLTNTGTETLVNLTTTGNTILGDASTDTLNVGNGGLIKDASGNVGVGVTPSAWGSRKALEVGNAGSALFSVGANQNYLTSNSYFDGAFKYGATGTATAYQQYAGTHAWLNAASGSAGGVVTFTQAMTLDASGNLIVNGTSAVNTGSGRGNITLNGSAGAILQFTVGGADKGWIFHDNTNLTIQNTTGSGALILNTNNAERARIDSSGNLLVGTTSSDVAGGGVSTRISSNNGTGYGATNVNTGTATYSVYQLGNSNTANRAGLALFGSAYTSSGLYRQDGVYLYAGGNGGVTISSESAQPIYFATSNTERARIASNGSVGIGITNPEAYSLGGNTAGLVVNGPIYSATAVQGRITSVGYLPTTAGGSAPFYAKLGTFTCGQGGFVCHLRVYYHQGYNASNSQNAIYDVFFKTSNGGSSQSGSTGAFYGDGQVFRLGPSGSATFYVSQTNTSSYDIWASLGTFSENMFYTVNVSQQCDWTASTTYNTTGVTGNYITLTANVITYT